MTSVTITGISKSYQAGVPVLKPIDLTIQAGELFFLLGPSGCGKSTLLRILAGLVEPDGGSIRFNGREITRLPAEKRRAAMVFQNYALWPHLTVFENVAFGLRAEGADNAKIRKEVADALELVQLADCAERKIPSLSGGQQQRVALARALAMRPDLLLLDEPLSNLDARLRDTMRREIRRIAKERELTAIYVTHDRQEALSMADRLAVMHQGILQQVGAPEEVYNLPVNRFVAGFLGDANFIDGTVTENGLFRSHFGEFQLAPTAFRPETGRKITAAIRPERIRFAAQKGAHTFSAKLTDRTFLGECCEWKFDADGLALEVTESAPPMRRIGDVCELEFDPGHLIALQG
ncbi:ABC transporter ATP-binding protein [Victivallis vadensis]|uniref:Iron(III) transport system ATP-binding protein n=1 Tax=Victivallis vadensis TaxID=172901 RepID=A0A2U1AQF6_9BACT|nr:ABC transporter ATP-binding protein [Victivallis vadensis]PVY38636.1 iron(III) transport system ATP-binding protein [Victivallis vadensis]